MNKTETATFRTTRELKDRVDNLARLTKRSSGFYYNLLLEEYLDDIEDLYLGEKVLEDIESGKEKTVSAEEARKELGL